MKIELEHTIIDGLESWNVWAGSQLVGSYKNETLAKTVYEKQKEQYQKHVYKTPEVQLRETVLSENITIDRAIPEADLVKHQLEQVSYE